MSDSCQPVVEVLRRRHSRPGFERRAELAASPGNRLDRKVRVDVQGRAADSTGFLDFTLLKIGGREVDAGKCLVTGGTLGAVGGVVGGDDQRGVLLGLGWVIQPDIAGAGVEGEVGLLESEDAACLVFAGQAAERPVGTVQRVIGAASVSESCGGACFVSGKANAGDGAVGCKRLPGPRQVKGVAGPSGVQRDHALGSPNPSSQPMVVSLVGELPCRVEVDTGRELVAQVECSIAKEGGEPTGDDVEVWPSREGRTLLEELRHDLAVVVGFVEHFCWWGAAVGEPEALNN